MTTSGSDVSSGSSGASSALCQSRSLGYNKNCDDNSLSTCKQCKTQNLLCTASQLWPAGQTDQHCLTNYTCEKGLACMKGVDGDYHRCRDCGAVGNSPCTPDTSPDLCVNNGSAVSKYDDDKKTATSVCSDSPTCGHKAGDFCCSEEQTKILNNNSKSSPPYSTNHDYAYVPLGGCLNKATDGGLICSSTPDSADNLYRCQEKGIGTCKNKTISMYSGKCPGNKDKGTNCPIKDDKCSIHGSTKYIPNSACTQYWKPVNPPVEYRHVVNCEPCKCVQK